MKRKHIPGCYCCTESTCYELQESDLPDVTLLNWTSSGWVGTPCCKCVTLTPNAPVATVTCSADYATAKMDIDCEWDLRAITNAKWKEASAVTCPVPDNWCCAGPVIKVGEGTSVEELHYNYRILFYYIPAKIDVCISKQDVDCAGVVAEKYVLLSRYCYNVMVYSVRGSLEKGYYESTLTNTCFQKNDVPNKSILFGQPYCDLGDPDGTTREPPCDIDDLSPELGDELLFSGLACFTRVKFLDNPPDGDLVFNNDDDGNGCTWTLCDTSFEFITEYCYTVSSFDVKPCWCDHEWTLTPQTTTTEILSTCGCDTCLDTGLPGTNYIRIIDCDPFDSVFECCTGRTCNSVCSTYTTTCYEAEWSAGPEDNCDLDGSQGFFCRGQCGGFAAACFGTKPSEDAPSCYDTLICGTKLPIYTPIANTATSASWTIDCQFLGALDFCISAPTWTLTFS